MIEHKSTIAILMTTFVLSTSLGTMLYKYYQIDVLTEIAINEVSKVCTHDVKEQQHLPSCDKYIAKDYDKSEEVIVDVDDTQQKENNSILKSGSSFVSVIYVLVNYLFSNPLDSQAQSHPLF